MTDISSWFIVLPDGLTNDLIASRLESAPQRISHASGRPWIVGRWRDGSVELGEAGRTRIALIGQNGLTSPHLDDEAKRISSVQDADRISDTLHGSSHLLVSTDGVVRVQGTLVGVRRVYYVTVGGTVVAADRADVLADLAGSTLDESRLALRLLDSPALYPLGGQPVWRRVEMVPTNHYLVMTPRSTRTMPRWSPPEPVVPMSEGAVRLRDALGTAVGLRIGKHDLVSADLGGLDSTSLCALVARGSTPLVAYTAAINDPRGDDVQWASRTVAGLGNVEHHIIPAAEMPIAYEGVLDHHERFDEPCTSEIDIRRSMTMSRRAASRGSHLHFVGIGGDELLYGAVAHMHSLILHHPWTAMRYLRGFATKYRWTPTATFRQLADRRPYRSWLNQVAVELTEPTEPMRTPLLDWGFKPRLPPWVTREAVDAVGDLLRTEAATAEPWSPRRGQHRELEGMRSLTCLVRQYEQLAAGVGVTLAAPYYDDRVIEAGLTVRPEERITPWRYKPLIVEAMRGVVPDDSLRRETKATAAFEEEVGMRRHRRVLLDLCENSRLDQLGLVDANMLKQVCSQAVIPQVQRTALHQTMGCELWLRQLEVSSIPSAQRSTVEAG